MIRVVIADDQQVVRAGITVVLEAAGTIEVVGQASDGDQAVRLANDLRPDVVCMDIRMPGRDGIEATRALSRATPPIPVLVLTTFDIDEYVFGALEAGAAGLLLKGTDEATLVDAVRSVAQGEGTLDHTLTRRVLTEFAVRRSRRIASDAEAGLTAREVDVLRLLAGGASNLEIAAALFIEASTVKFHVTRILDKIGARDRLQAAVWAIHHGFDELRE